MIKRLRLDRFSALYLWGFFMIVFGFLRPKTFLSGTSVQLVIVENVISGVLAIAFLIPLTTGTYDLSIGTLMSLSLVITNILAKNHVVPPLVGMLIALLACVIAGFVSGFIVVKLRVNSFIATLGMSQVITAVILKISRQTISGAFTKSYQDIGNTKILGLPLFVYFLAVLAIVAWYVLEHTPVGRYMFATGGNPEAARLAGVRTDRLVWGSLIVSGLIAGFAGTVYSWKVGTYSQSIGPGYLFPAIAAVFFGASQLKARPNVVGTLIALYALAWGIKGIQLTFSSDTEWITPLFTGLSLLTAVALASRQAIIKVRTRKADAAAPAVVAAAAAELGT
jgi:ribose transport system permease protein